MATRRQGRSSGRGSRRRPNYVWTGLHLTVPTDIPTAGVVGVLVPGTTVERHGQLTVERIRGMIEVMNTDTDSANGRVNVAWKVIQYEINDAGVITGDHQGIDTDEEDIAQRILAQGAVNLGAAAGTDFQDVEHRWMDIDIKARVRIHDAKHEVGVLMDSSTANRAQFILNMRALCRVN